MTISRAISEAMTNASWIRRMFEQGLKLKRELGVENVADMALGNPVVEPPARVIERMKVLVSDKTAGTHRYMPNRGFRTTRAAVAAHLEKHTGVPYTLEHVVMTVGAGGALNVFFKALLDPGDEVISLSPFFVEYRSYVANHGGKLVLVDTDEQFKPDIAAIEAAITSRTRAVVVNAPNNPTGVVYSEEDYDALGAMLEAKSAELGQRILLVSDEPYRAITYDGVDVPWPVRHYADTVHITSFSKDLAMPGERIGYLAVNPSRDYTEELAQACTFTNRILGFVNAPALQQRLVEGLLDVQVDMTGYTAKRDQLLAALDGAGYEYVRPQGAFYIFPKTPGGMDDVEFVNLCLEERLLVVPGSGFGRAGHFRISYAVTDRDVELGAEALARVASKLAKA